ncbi:MAG: GC-type dockerin domain-anchored protein [Phycisphaerales bacterium JB059]
MSVRMNLVIGLVSAWWSTVAMAQWTDDAMVNTPVVTGAHDQDVIKLDAAPDGSIWVGWNDFQPGGIEVRVQRLDRGGLPTFAPGGLLVSDHPQNTFVVDWDLRADADGNCMLAFVDTRDGGDLDVHAYLIASDGTMLWGADGVTVSENSAFEADPRIIQNTEGDYLVVWARFDVEPGLYLQRISPAGMVELAPGGVRIVGDGGAEPAFVEIEPTAEGDFIATWVHDTSTFLSDRYVMVQRFGSDGAGRWSGGQSVIVMDATVVPIAHRPRLIEVGGGAVIAWHDTRDGDFDCYVQRLDAAGVHVWPEDGVSVSTVGGRQQLDPAIALEPGGEVMVFFRNMDGAQAQQGVNVQRIDVSGFRALGDGGVEVMAFDGQFKGPPRAVSTPGGVAALVDRRPTTGSSDGVLEAIRVNASGALLDAGSIGVSTGASTRGRLGLANASDASLVAVWSDDRGGTLDAYAQRIRADGTLCGPLGCNPSDLAPAYGVLDFSDVVAFLSAFSVGEAAADLASPFGVWDFSDVVVFLSAFGAGCP